MPGVKISALPALTAAALTDVIADVQSGVTYKGTLQQLLTLFLDNIGSGGQLTDGQLLIGSTGNPPVPNTLTAGANISIGNTAGVITIAATGLAGIGWTEVTGASQTMVADSGYVSNRATLVTFTLPVTAAFGTLIYLQGLGVGGWIIAQGAGQSINIGSVSSTVGVGGSVASTDEYDSVALLCVAASTQWAALTGVQGILTIV